MTNQPELFKGYEELIKADTDKIQSGVETKYQLTGKMTGN
jgi:hypothetical protein